MIKKNQIFQQTRNSDIHQDLVSGMYEKSRVNIMLHGNN